MKGTLNQDTELHESCQQLSWRGGMGPSVAAYEWLTDSRCVWHELQKCEEVVKISAAPRRASRNPASKISKPKCTLCPIRHSDILQNCTQGCFFVVVVVVAKYDKLLHRICNTQIHAFGIVLTLSHLLISLSICFICAKCLCELHFFNVFFNIR